MSLSRRKFLNTSMHALMSLTLAPLGVHALLGLPYDQRRLRNNRHMVANKEASMATVAITHNSHIEIALKEALGHLPVEALVRDKFVAVKPNETFAKTGATGGVTQPDTLKAVLQFLKQFQPRRLVVSGGSGAAKTDEVFRVAGLMKIVDEEGVEFFDHNRPPFVSVELPYAPEKEVAGPQQSILVNPRVLEYDTLVALNQLKVHNSATVTLALKNIAMSYPPAEHYGYPRANRKHEHHFIDDLHSFIASMAKRFPIQLAITVGHPAMIGNGPLDGHLVDTGLVIASTDALAADVVGAYILGFNIQAVRHLWEADRLSVGESRLGRMKFPAMSLKEAVAAFTEAAYGKRLQF
jgi:uncharacterized protein (DUF362 family)